MKLLPLFESTSYPTDALLARVSAGHPLEIGDEIEDGDSGLGFNEASATADDPPY